MSYCTGCGHYLTVIRSGGCGGEGEVAGCSKCDTLYNFRGGGMCTSAHPVLDNGGSFKAAFYREAKRIKPRNVACPGPHHNRWVWSTPGYFEFYYFDTEQEANGWLDVYLKSLHDGLPWPMCPICNKKPEEPYGFGAKYFKCKPCETFFNGSNWTTSDGEPVSSVKGQIEIDKYPPADIAYYEGDSSLEMGGSR